MKKRNLSVPVGIITGILSALLVQVLFASFDGLNVRYNWGIELSVIRGLIGLFSLVILGTGIYAGMQRSRKLNDDALTWAQAVVVGVIISLITGLISAIGAILFSYLNPGFSDRIIKESIALLAKEGKSSEQIQLYSNKLKEELAPFMIVVQAFTGQLIGGTLISFTMAIFIKRKSKK